MSGHENGTPRRSDIATGDALGHSAGLGLVDGCEECDRGATDYIEAHGFEAYRALIVEFIGRDPFDGATPQGVKS
jgi:hypothetical protein